jgi:hypothetical protein|tara:strand:+ start:425 stop:2452 length:2028 start_codon:yes stop_codon:yes gene_type:complete
MSNSLANESSPYLLQHKDNPVDWYSWNDESLEIAKKENKPIFLSVGYSSCHWCHVMAHESFENDDVAKIMNDSFVNIKVDREERPDIDDIYQKVCQMSTGQGGWPLSVFLTPDQRPFYVGTYFPVLDGYGRPGFGSLCRQLAQSWKEKPSDIEKAAENFMINLSRLEKISEPSKITKSILDEAAVNLLQIADTNYGGFGQAPKFPNASNLSFMFRYSKLSGISKFKDFALLTLKRMARGGIFDQIGGGFHRYSTDARWLVPHFEKMLYDNALLPIVYCEAYQITKDPFFLDVVKKTLDYVIREMTSPEGVFYSAQDADTDGEEGQTFVWKKNEIEEILGNDSDLFCIYYDVTDGGNFEGKTILANNIKASALAFKFGKSEDQVHKIISDGAEKLLDVRKKRVQPGKDDKALTAWNGLMISAFIKGYKISGESKYLKVGLSATNFYQAEFEEHGVLNRVFKDGTSKLNAYLDDYAYLTNAVVDMFEITGELKHLEFAIKLSDYLVEHFWDEKNASFFFTADNHEKLIIRPKSNYDLSMPSGNSVAANAFLRLYHITQEEKFHKITQKILESQAVMASENPFAFGYLLNVLYLAIKKPTEITILNTENHELIDILNKKFIPESIMVQIDTKSKLDSLSKLLFFTGKQFSQSETNVFVCKDFSCSLPLTNIEDVEENL